MSNIPKDMGSFSFYSRINWWIVCILLLVLISANTYLGRATVSELTQLQTNIRDSGNVIKVLEELHVELLTAESGQRGFLLTRNGQYLTHYNRVNANILNLMKEASVMDSMQSEQNLLVAELLTKIEQKLLRLERAISLNEADKAQQVADMIEDDEGLSLYTEIQSLFARIKENENAIRESQINQLEKATIESKANMMFSFIIGLVLVVGVFFLARINLQNQLQRQYEIEQQNETLQNAVNERTQELSIFSEELKRSNRELEDFAFVASHDLQEPLRKIMTFSDRLSSQSDSLNEKQMDYLTRMSSAAKRMSTLISDLLEFSRVNTRGKSFVAVNLNELVQLCVDDLSVAIEENGTTLDIPLFPEIQADPLQMQQLFYNLLANAIKFSKDESHPEVRLTVESSVAPENTDALDLSDWYTFSVIDNGIGFEQQHAEKIFAPFQRLHSRNSYSGTGIGLAVCRRIIERHNGSIEASGNEGSGAIFKFTLPAKNKLISFAGVIN